MHLILARHFLPVALLLCLCLSAVVLARAPAAAPPSPTITVLFDNTTRDAGCTAGWGFSALIEGVGGRTILFDAGAQEPVLRQNVNALHADLAKVDLVFVSHDHNDHTGGLSVALEKKRGVPVYLPAGAKPAFVTEVRAKGGQVTAVKDAQQIIPGAWSTGDLGEAIHEHALLLDTPRGLVVMTGCAHPGIVAILERAKTVAKKDIWMVLGGFHLYETPPVTVDGIIARFKALGVQRVGATHCTGEAAMAKFREAFGSGFVELGVGAKIQ